MQKKILKKLFCSWDNCIWISCIKLSLLRRAYLSLAVNVLTNSLEILHMTRRDFFRLKFLQSDQKISSKCCRSDFNSVWLHWRCSMSKSPPKQDFLDNYLTPLFGVRNLENASAIRVIFFRKCFKFNIDLKYWKKIPQNVFFFWDHCIWIGCIKLSLLNLEYISLAVNVLATSLKILHITKRDFSRLNCVHSDQCIW